MKGETLNYHTFDPIPLETDRTACSVFNPANPYLQIGNQVDHLIPAEFLGNISQLIGVHHKVAAMLVLITAFQYKEQLTDKQAAEAVRVRIDWKYALHLSMISPGIRPSLLCDFRYQLFQDLKSFDAYDEILSELAKIRFFDESLDLGNEKILQELCTYNRIERIQVAMKDALALLAARKPDWLRYKIRRSWYTRYLHQGEKKWGKQRIENPLLLVFEIGKDIQYLLTILRETGNPGLLQEPEVVELRKVLSEQFETVPHEAVVPLLLRWREGQCLFFNGAGGLVRKPDRRCYQD